MSHLRHRLLALTCAASAVLATGATADASDRTATSSAVAGTAHPGLDRLLAGGTPNGRAIVSFAGVPTASQVAALEALGLTVQPLERLPMALVAGPVAAMTEAVTSGIGLDVHRDEELDTYNTASSDVMSSSTKAARALRARASPARV